MTPSILPVVSAIQAAWRKDLREGKRMPNGPAKPQPVLRSKKRK